VIGEGSQRAALQEETRRLGIQEIVEYAGATRDIVSALAGLDVLVVSSTREGCANVILEAMAAGIPVVATSVGGNPELIEDGVSGLLVAAGNPGDTTGDSLHCRLYHASVAVLDPATHCPHALAQPDSVCVPGEPTCGEYCQVVTANCTEANLQYADQAACLASCAGMVNAEAWATGSLADTSGNTLGCRIYHAGAAETDAATHCPHAGLLGGDVCGAYCDNYCDFMGGGCPAEYPDGAACKAACGAFPAGTPGETTGDSLQCRLYHAGVAVFDPTTHCPHAKQDPDAVCVPPDPTCGVYCNDITANCAGAHLQYADEPTCLTKCADMLADQAMDLGSLADTAGNTLGCRIYHAGASANDPATHCSHAGQLGGGVCGTYCETYCDFMTAACPGDSFSGGSCPTVCAGFTSGTPGDTTGDSLQCRLYHASVALTDATTHCPHAKQDPDAVCVPPDPSCEAYCASITANCFGPNLQYANEATCLTKCADMLADQAMDLGTSADTAGNTLGCRIYHAGASANDAATHCSHAGQLGGDVCGTYCETYCDFMTAACPGDTFSGGSCPTVCMGFTTGTPGDTTGDSLQCRLYHAGVALSDATTHCPHAKQAPDAVCVLPDPTCEEYCASITANCKDANAQYADEAACLTQCADMLADQAIDLGSLADTAGNTLGCRIYHAGASANDAATHCSHAGQLGGGVCGTYCENYCDFMTAACPGDTFSGGSCPTVCAGFTSGTPGDTNGDSLQCRLYHASVALSDATTHCPHAKQDPDAVCVPVDPTCKVYCQDITANCKDANAQYANESDCLTKCSDMLADQAIDLGSLADTAGNTLGCRIYHAGAAANDAATHCPHAGQLGGNVCGNYCEVYCDFVTAACPADTFSGGSCGAACGSFIPGTPGDTTGDSLQCRLYHASVALTDGATHCPHAKQKPDAVCVAPDPTCADYCASYFDSCGIEPYSAYQDEAECVGYCQDTLMPVGTLADTAGDTIGCRTYHAGAAGNDPATHCPHAGPDGGGVCGSLCENYCDLAMAVCPNMYSLDYTNYDDCVSTCATSFLQTAPKGIGSGNSVQCRIYHIGVASSFGAHFSPGPDNLHCGHANFTGGNICIDKPPKLIINEINYDMTGVSDIGEFVELYNAGDSAIPADGLAGVYLVFVNGGNAFYDIYSNVPPKHLELTFGVSIPAGGHAVVTNDPNYIPPGGVPVIMYTGSDKILNGNGGIAVVVGNPETNLVTVWDAVDYGAGANIANPLMTFAGGTVSWWPAEMGAAPVDPANSSDQAVARCSNGTDTNANSFDFVVTKSTPGSANDCSSIGTGEPVVSYQNDVLPIYTKYCSGCHVPGPFCSGGGCWNSHADLMKPSYYCSGKTKGACTVVRIEDKSMPKGKPGSVLPADLEILKAWIADGMPNN
jgi:hypothetical protein